MATGAVLIGLISDKVKNRKYPLVISAIINCSIWGVLAFTIPSLSILKLLMPVMGMFGSFIVLSLSIAKEVNNPEFSGMSTSFANMGLFLGGAIIPTLFGSIIDKYSPSLSGFALYQKGFTLCFTLALLGLFASLLAKETNCQNIYTSNLK